MTPNQSFVYQMLSDYLNRRETVLPDEIDLDEVHRLCLNHQVEGILYYQIRKCSNAKPDILQKLLSGYAQTLYFYKNRQQAIQKIDREFTAAGIPYIIYKGSEITSLYPVPELRTMADTDVLVREENQERAGAIWDSMGMNNISRSGAEWDYIWNQMGFELHSMMLREETANPPEYVAFARNPWDRATAPDGSTRYHLDLSFHFIYILMHLRKHFLNRGVGLRQFMDISVVAESGDLNWEWITGQFRDLGLTEFASVVFALCNHWFQTVFPFLAEPDEDFFEEASVQILENGVYGFDAEGNQDNLLFLKIQKDAYFGVKKFIRSVFPPYETLRTNTKFHGLDGRPFLLPVFWIIRMVRAIFEGRAVDCVDNAADTRLYKDGAKSRSEYLKKWGL